MTKNSRLAAVVVSLCLCAAARSEDKPDSHFLAAQELLRTMNLEKTFGQSMDEMLKLQIKQQPQIAPFKNVMRKFLHKHMGWKAIKDDMARIYVSEFTEKELKDLTAFYKTPTGKKAAEKLPVLMAKGAQLGMKRVQDNMRELQQMIETEKRRLKEERDNPIIQ